MAAMRARQGPLMRGRFCDRAVSYTRVRRVRHLFPRLGPFQAVIRTRARLCSDRMETAVRPRYRCGVDGNSRRVNELENDSTGNANRQVWSGERNGDEF